MYTRILKIKAVSALSLLTLHYGAHGYVTLETKTRTAINAEADSITSSLARSWGYERPQPKSPEPRPLSINEIIYEESVAQNLNPSLIYSLMKVESNGDPLSLSRSGALGLMQILPSTASRYGVDKRSLLDPRTNIKTGVRVFKDFLRAERGHVPNALQAYNGGSGCVNLCPESIEHSRKVLSLWASVGPEDLLPQG